MFRVISEMAANYKFVSPTGYCNEYFTRDILRILLCFYIFSVLCGFLYIQIKK